MDYGELDYQNGWLCIREYSYDNNEPKRIVYYWPIEQTPLAWAKQIMGDDFIGKEVIRHAYSYEWYSIDLHRNFLLLNGEKTKALRVETEMVDRPKTRPGIELRWHNGYWQKYLKSKGWVAA